MISTVITSRQHPLCKLVRSLHSVKGRKKEKLFVVEGGNGVAAALQARWTLQRLLVPNNELGEEWKMLARAADVETQVVDDEILEYLSEAQTSPDVIAIARMPIADSSRAFSLFTLVLDGVGDPGNVGTLIRSADAVGASDVVLANGGADAWSPKVVRASAGSVFHLPPQSSTGNELVRDLRSQNVPIVAAVAHDGEDCFGFLWPPRCALVLGHETRGISEELEKAATARVTIPVFGKAESLNVASAGAVLLYAWRQNHR